MEAENLSLNQLLNKIDTSTFKQVDYTKFFIWYLTDIEGKDDCLMADIVRCFRDVSLSIPNQTVLRRNLRKSKDVTVGHSYKSFRLHRDALLKYRTAYSNLLPSSPSPEEKIRERLDVSHTPLLTPGDIDNAYKMGQVYVAIHCLENSARSLIRKVLNNALGEQWWDKAASDQMKRKLAERKSRETKKRWLTSRGADELNYLDWGDLVTLIRKYEEHFVQFIGSTKFAELKLEELENLRNVIAHNGVLPDEEVVRVELYFKDWCKQVSK
ncbi:hypothetical protein ES703_91372 [subsurface metagenome]